MHNFPEARDSLKSLAGGRLATGREPKNPHTKSPSSKFARCVKVVALLAALILIVFAQSTESAAESTATTPAQDHARAGDAEDSKLGAQRAPVELVEQLLLEYPSPRNAKMIAELRKRQLDFRIFYPRRQMSRQRRSAPAGGSEAYATSTKLDSDDDLDSNSGGDDDDDAPIRLLRRSKSDGRRGDKRSGSKQQQQQQQQQLGQHYNRTNVVIRAFNYKFRLDLELNNNLFGPNLIQKHFLPKGGQQISTQRIEHCYYHGRTQAEVRPVAIGAFRTCNGLSGIIHVNNESFVILPFYNADVSSKHPHIIYRYQTDDRAVQSEPDEQQPRRRECGNTRLHEWALRQYNKLFTLAPSSSGGTLGRRHLAGPADQASKPFSRLARGNIDSLSDCERSGNSCDELGPGFTSTSGDSKLSDGASSAQMEPPKPRFSKRDVSLTEKYIELALVLSQDMFDKRNSSSRLEVLHDAIQIVNCLDLYFRSANTRVSLTYVETWAHGDQVDLTSDVKQTLYNFLEYSTRKLYKVSMDAAHLLTGGHARQFDLAQAGMSIPDSICSSRAVSVSQEASVFEPFVAASTMAHMLGHNLGMEHDSDQERVAGASDTSETGGAPPEMVPVPTAAGALSSELLSVGVAELGNPGTAGRPRVSQLAGGRQAHRQFAKPSSQVARNEEQSEEHEDEIKSRSLAARSLPGSELDSNGSSAEPFCLAGCLMSEHFAYPPSPVSFGNILHNSSLQQQQPQSNESTMVATFQLPGAETGDEMVELAASGQSGSPRHSHGLPFRFSRQSIETYHKLLRMGHSICLFNKPNQLEDFKACGNGIVDKGEDCDCGTFQECAENGDSCCDPITCRFKVEAECINGACCDRCRLRARGFVCRKARGECDLAEICDGKSGQCAPDVYKQNGHPCAQGQGHCFMGQCPTHDQQCAELWASDAKKSDRLCYSQFNLNGTIRGNCGYDAALRKYKRCDHEHMMCGTLQCQLGDMKPVTAQIDASHASLSHLELATIVAKSGFNHSGSPASSAGNFQQPSQANVHEFSKKIIHAHDGSVHECKVITGTSSQPAATSSPANLHKLSYVRDGSKCATNRVCFNQTCQPIEQVYRDSFELCPKDERGRQCSGNGICSTANRCHCEPNWTGHDCSQRQLAPTPSDSIPAPPYADVVGQQQLAASLSPINTLANSSPVVLEPEQVTQAPASIPPTVETTTTSKPIPAPAPSNNGTTSNMLVPDKTKHDALGAPTLVFILVSIVAAVYVGFALMANCYRRKGFYKPDKVLRHHQLNCKLDAIRSSFIAKRLADVENVNFDLGPSTNGSAIAPLVSVDGVDLLSPYVSPLSAPPDPVQYFVQPNQRTEGATQAAASGSGPDQILQPQRPYNTHTFSSGNQPAATHQHQHQRNFYQQQQQQQQQQYAGGNMEQISASVHYFDDRLPPGGPQADHVPLLMTADPTQSSNQRAQALMRTFNAADGRSARSDYDLWTTRQQPTVRQQQHQQPPLSNMVQRNSTRSHHNPINRATSLGNVSRQLQQQQQQRQHPHQHHHHRYPVNSSAFLNDSLEASDDERMDTHHRLSAQHRALATPLRTAKSRTRSSHPFEVDSCSAPSSPELHREPYWIGWTATSTGTRLLHTQGHSHGHHHHSLRRQQPTAGGGYHEDVIFDAIAGEAEMMQQQPTTNHRRSLIDNSAGAAPNKRESVAQLSRQHSAENENDVVAREGNEDDSHDVDQLPPPPPPHLEEPDTGDESEPSGRHQRSAANQGDLKSATPTTRTLRRVPLNNGVDVAGSRPQAYIDHKQLSLIAQLQQLEQVQTLYQKQASGSSTKSSAAPATAAASTGDSLHEFFSLPLSIQLSALLARSLADNHDSSISTIDDILNNLNNSSVANLSRKNFKPSNQQPQQTNSRGGTMKRHQMKLQNLQGLISRLQKLHSQTALQQQLEEFSEFDQLDDQGVDPSHSSRPSGSRQSTLNRSHRTQSILRPNQTADDLFEFAHQASSGKTRRAHTKRTIHKSSRDDMGPKNESIYSMSDSEDGLFVSRILNSYNQQQQAPLQATSSSNPANEGPNPAKPNAYNRSNPQPDTAANDNKAGDSSTSPPVVESSVSPPSQLEQISAASSKQD